MKRIVLWSLLASLAISSFAATTPVTALIEREKAKWDFEHADPDRLAKEFAADFVEIGYKPDGVRRTVHPDIAATMRELKAAAPSPAPQWTLSDFEVVHPSPDTVLLSYRADGFMKLYATSVWVRRNGKWATVFYQATSR